MSPDQVSGLTDSTAGVNPRLPDHRASTPNYDHVLTLMLSCVLNAFIFETQMHLIIDESS